MALFCLLFLSSFSQNTSLCIKGKTCKHLILQSLKPYGCKLTRKKPNWWQDIHARLIQQDLVRAALEPSSHPALGYLKVDTPRVQQTPKVDANKRTKSGTQNYCQLRWGFEVRSSYQQNIPPCQDPWACTHSPDRVGTRAATECMAL